MADDQPGTVPGQQPNAGQTPVAPPVQPVVTPPVPATHPLPPPPITPTAPTPDASAPAGPAPVPVEPTAPAAPTPAESPVDQAALDEAREAVATATDSVPSAPAATPVAPPTPSTPPPTTPEEAAPTVSSKDLVEKDLFTLLKLEDLPEEEKEKFRTEVMEIVRDRVLLRIHDGLSEEDRTAFNTLLEGTPDEAKMQSFLKDHAIDLNQLMIEETILYKAQLVQGVGPIATPQE